MSTIKKELCTQKKKRLPYSLNKGHFQTVFYNGQKQTLIWKFGQHNGCSEVASENHNQLPNLNRRADLEVTPLRAEHGIGSAFMFPGTESLVEGSYGSHHLPYSVIKNAVEKVESERQIPFIEKIKETFKDVYVQEWGGVEDCFCRFTGGGDVLIIPKSKKVDNCFCIFIYNWIKCGTVELKYTQCSCSAIELQLQANMMVIGSKCLYQILETGNDVEKITVYGLGFGVFHELLLLELTVDFAGDVMKFDQLFCYPPSPEYHVAIDSSIAYIIVNKL